MKLIQKIIGSAAITVGGFILTFNLQYYETKYRPETLREMKIAIWLQAIGLILLVI